MQVVQCFNCFLMHSRQQNLEQLGQMCAFRTRWWHKGHVRIVVKQFYSSEMLATCIFKTSNNYILPNLQSHPTFNSHPILSIKFHHQNVIIKILHFSQVINMQISEINLEKDDLPAQIVLKTKESFQTKELIRSLLGEFKKIKQIIEKDLNFEKYLKKLSISRIDILNGFTKIQKSVQMLEHRIDQNLINFYAIKEMANFLQGFLQAQDIQSKDSKEKIVWFLEVETKVIYSLDFLQKFKTEIDITNDPNSKKNYEKVWERITSEPIGDLKKTKSEFQFMKKVLFIAVCAVLNEEKYDWALCKKCAFGMSFPKYFIMSDSAKLKSFRFYRNPTIDFAQRLWNLPETGGTKQLIKIIFEGIKTNLKFYLPFDKEIDENFNIFEENESALTIRLLFHQKLELRHKKKKKGFFNEEEDQKHETIMIHLHGGGFVALSSRSMQSYTRRWANQLKIPIFSVDYRMPPNHPFPTAPLDCLKAYQFIINHIQKYVNIKPKNIIIAGDSAGGNLACSLTGLILKNKLLMPKYVYLAYPAMDIRPMFSHSRLFALTDVLLWPSMLDLCLKSYLNNDMSKSEDPLASPILLTEEYVGGQKGDKRFPLRWPKTMITCGGIDPLYDDSLLLMQKLVESNIECEAHFYQNLSHGYLSLGATVKACEETIKNSIIQLKRLIQIQQK